MLTLLVIFAAFYAAQGGAPLPKHVFPCGRQIPSIGLGSEKIGYDGRGMTAFVNAIDNGYRVLDTADIYDNKVTLGLAIKQQIEAKRIQRKDVFVISKVWNTEHRKEDVVHSFKNDVVDMGLDQLDAGIMHWPTAFGRCHTPYPKFENGTFKPLYWEKDRGYLEAYRGMEASFVLGLIGHIGIANININQLKKIFDIAFIRPVILQVECHPLFRNDKIVEFAKNNNITVMCAESLRENTPELRDNSVLKEIADKHKKKVQQVALRWNMQRGTVVLPGSQDKKHQRENIESLNFELDDDDMKKINGITEANRTVDLPGLKDHPDYPFGSDSD